MRQQLKPERRFWPKVMKTPSCWFWIGARTSTGYGNFAIVATRKTQRCAVAHRVAYEWLVGTIPMGLDLDHLCRVRHCVNPKHLEPVSRRTNLLRGIGPSAINAKKTSCPRGHEYTEANTYSRLNRRQCRACTRRPPRPPITHCPAGHQYDAINTHVDKLGHRHCRPCAAARARKIRMTADEYAPTVET